MGVLVGGGGGARQHVQAEGVAYGGVAHGVLDAVYYAEGCVKLKCEE